MSTGVINEWNWNFNDSYCPTLPNCSLFNSTSMETLIILIQ